MKRFIKQATFTKYNTRKDKSCSITFVTDYEVTPDDVAELHRVLDHHGILYFSDKGNLTKEEIEAIDDVDVELEGKSKSQRLRNVLYILYKQQGEIGEFKDFYSIWMEKIIQNFKDKLEDEN
jgi:hypothetical protein